MNVFLLTDLEGIAGVNDIEYMDRSGEKYAVAQKHLSHSINLAVKTCFEMGADNVYYLDGHGGGGNVIEDEVDSRAVKCGGVTQWNELLQEGKIDCQIELGAHARAGTIGGFLDHTWSSREYFCHKIGDRETSELYIHAILCAKYGVPIVACTGDEVACMQAREYIPDIYAGAVKKAAKRNIATTYENADEILVNTVREALKHYREVSIVKVEEPTTVELTYYRTDMCEKAWDKYSDGGNVMRVDARTLRKTVEMIKTYQDLKF